MVVRFKVIKGSHLLLGIAIAALIGVLLFIGIGYFAAENAPSASVGSEAKVVETFASALSGDVKIEIIPDSTPTQELQKEMQKSILIYHTHTHEAYEQDVSDPYEAIETWRTIDPTHSVVRVGDALAEALRMRGFSVVHDVTDHEQDDLSSAYVRSLETLENYSERFDLYIDLHRDAYVEGMSDCFESGGKQYAQLMLLVGRGDRHPAEQRPDYAANLDFAQRLTDALNDAAEGLCRNVTVKTGRYNQHIGTPAILIEVGHNKNTLVQALNSVEPMAIALTNVLSYCKYFDKNT